MASQKSTASEEQYHFLSNGARVKKSTIERSQSVLPGTIRQAAPEEYKSFAKDADGNVAGEEFAKRAILSILAHGLINDDRTMKTAHEEGVGGERRKYIRCGHP